MEGKFLTNYSNPSFLKKFVKKELFYKEEFAPADRYLIDLIKEK